MRFAPLGQRQLGCPGDGLARHFGDRPFPDPSWSESIGFELSSQLLEILLRRRDRARSDFVDAGRAPAFMFRTAYRAGHGVTDHRAEKLAADGRVRPDDAGATDHRHDPDPAGPDIAAAQARPDGEARGPAGNVHGIHRLALVTLLE